MQTYKQNRRSWIQTVRESNFIKAFNRLCVSPLGLAVLAALTLTSYIFQLELYFYGLVIAYVIYNCLFGEDFLPFVPLFVFCYISPSAGNNPGKAEESIFYGNYGGKLILCFAAIAVLALLFRIATDKDMGFKKLFLQKRSLWFGFVAIGIAYMLSGIGSEHYSEIALKNLFFAILQFLSLFFVYFLFSATIKWENVDKKYFAWMAIFLGLTVIGEVVHIYATHNVIVDNVINGVISGKKIERMRIYTGWGMYNNIGVMIAITLPFILYLAVTYRYGYFFIPLSVMFWVATAFTGSRGSMFGASATFIIAFILACIRAKNRGIFIPTVLLTIAIAVIVFLLFAEQISILFAGVPDLFQSDNLPKIESFWDLLHLFNDSNRFDTYKEGIKVFLNNRVFGDSFYPSDFAPWDFSELEKFSGFFPPRWHNTIIQLLASCGIVGISAYLLHRVQTILLFCIRPSVFKTFIAISLVGLLATSLLDCHMFNIGPAFFYSIALVFAEKVQIKKEPKKEED